LSSNVKVRGICKNYALRSYVISTAIAVSEKAFMRKCRLICQSVVSLRFVSHAIKRFYGLIAMEISSHVSFLDYLLC
jgi:hypothetical protein